MHRVWNTTYSDIKIHSVPVTFSDAVEDGRFVFLSVSECGPQTVGPCVTEKQPVSNTELRQQTSLHHLIQIISRRTPQTAGEQRLFCAHLLTKHHITHDHWEHLPWQPVMGSITKDEVQIFETLSYSNKRRSSHT